MREEVRESRLDSLDREESWGEINGGFRKKDFREGLVSVFLDNLNPGMDSVSLWGFLKPFGRVRDVFLASKKSSCSSVFGFARYYTMEEATKLVKMVNGRFLEGWPIRAKVAAFGWNSRRLLQSNQHGKYVVEGMNLAREKDGLESSLKAGSEGNKTFVEVVLGN
ncbi:hypothetical protein LWI29_033891 [Acer saccharum]|uniref:RRM domain-containing protein n=1 Tax=Acer saccharum TaxID=4024 RepID=A0AA39VZQ8_ACESA|nr:hypothetical protein LWI29_033891 [Acer saccharum]